MALLSTVPTYPLPGKVRIIATATNGGTYIRAWCTNAPPGSKLRAKLDASASGRVDAFTADPGEAREIELDKSGVYTFAAQEYTLGASATGGGYQNAPGAAPTETKLGSEDSRTVSVLTRVEVPIGPAEHRAKLVLYVHGSAIRPTTLEQHKFKSPALLLPSSERAKVAIDDATVQTKLAALADTSVSIAIGDISAAVDDFLAEYSAHRQLITDDVHAAADNDNAITTVPPGSKSVAGLIAAINDCAKALDRHMRNDSGSGTNSQSAKAHSTDVDRPDFKNALAFKSAGDMAAARALFADVHRAYEAHRVQFASPVVHEIADSTNALAELSPLLQLDSAWLAAIAPTSPTAPATQNSGAVALVAAAGGVIV